MAEKWTPGPWHTKDGVIVADIPSGEFQTTPVAYARDEWRYAGGLANGMADANARLIAAAPDLYDALMKITTGSITAAASPDVITAIEDLMELIRETAAPALAKARG